VINFLVASLTQDEAEQTRALHVAGTGEPRLSEFGGILSLRALDLVARSSGLIDQLEEGRLTSWFHPILETCAPHKVFAHEALLRGLDRDGSVQSPEPLLTLARAAGLLPALDSAACLSAIRATAQHGPGLRVFINFSPAAVDDPERHLRAVEQAVDEAGLPRSQVVFEVVEADRIDDTARLETVLRGYRAAGFSVALDDLGAGWSTLNLVHRLRPDFIKLDRELVHQVHLNPVKGMIAGKLLEICQGLGIASIVEGVEVAEELDWVRAHGADFVQGFLFGRPSETPRLQPGFA
jgi:EAL domain-containing protein (putative c-di-GMP-specific phosphodiesterase class I)